ncbi:hypothetical protein GYMLUDRAFT_51286, partial [Collybiopsis luxurians FD-317 M1]
TTRKHNHRHGHEMVEAEELRDVSGRAEGRTDGVLCEYRCEKRLRVVRAEPDNVPRGK